jgi:hypothetical protein
MGNLREANFDPEFFTRHEDEIVKSMALKFPFLKLTAPV